MAIELNLLPDVKKEYLKSKKQRNLVVSISVLVSIISGGVIVVLILILGGLNLQKGILLSQIGDPQNPDSGSYIGKIKAAQKDDSKDLNSVLTVQNNMSQISGLKSNQEIFSRLFFGSPEEQGYLAQMNPASPTMISIGQLKIGLDSSASSAATAGAANTANVIQMQGSAWNKNNPNGGFDALNTYIATLQSTTISYSVGDNSKMITENLFSKVSVAQQQLSQDSSQSDGKTLPVNFTINLTYNKAAFALNSKNISIKVPQKSSSDAISNAPTSVFGENANGGEIKLDTSSSTNQGGQK